MRMSGSSREESPWPRQSWMSTVKRRSRSSPMTSKYFSMNSVRPVESTTVPMGSATGKSAARC